MHPAFTAEEFRGRVGRIQKAMAERALDALLVTRPQNVYYLTGFRSLGTGLADEARGRAPGRNDEDDDARERDSCGSHHAAQCTTGSRLRGSSAPLRRFRGCALRAGSAVPG